MPRWDANLYLRFGQERTQAAVDLVAHIELERPRRIVDLGCGPGNSTAVQRARWPEAEITGVDQSAEMLAEARCGWPDGRWIEGDIADWSADEPCDLVFSNAALQSVHGQAKRVPHLVAQVAPGGALASSKCRCISIRRCTAACAKSALDARWRWVHGPRSQRPGAGTPRSSTTICWRRAARAVAAGDRVHPADGVPGSDSRVHPRHRPATVSGGAG